MRISELRRTSVEALGAGCVGLACALMISPKDASLGIPGPHVVWIAVILVAARYGTEGLLLALPLVWGLLAATAGFLNSFGMLTARLDRPDDLAGLGAAVLVGWIASTHEKRHDVLSTKLEAAHQRGAAQQSLLDEFEDAFLVLRGRADRLDLSLSFLRDVAARLEGDDPEAAAEATLALASARLGARAGVVQLGGGQGSSAPAILASSGPWSSGSAALDLDADQAVAAAMRTGTPIRAGELAQATPAGADLAVPLLDTDGQPIGVLAVRGVPHGGNNPAALQDLAVMGGWLSTALHRSPRAVAAADTKFIDDSVVAEPLLPAPAYIEMSIYQPTHTAAMAVCESGAPS